MLLCLSGGFYPALQPDGASHLSPLLSFINAEIGADLLPWGGLANKHFKAFTVKCSSEAVSRLREDIPLLPEPQPLSGYPSLTLQGKPLSSIKRTLQESAVWGLIPRVIYYILTIQRDLFPPILRILSLFKQGKQSSYFGASFAPKAPVHFQPGRKTECPHRRSWNPLHRRAAPEGTVWLDVSPTSPHRPTLLGFSEHTSNPAWRGVHVPSQPRLCGKGLSTGWILG